MLYYKINVLSELKAHGYNTNRLRKDKILPEGTIQAIREGRPISWSTVNLLCTLLQLQPGDIVGFEDEHKVKERNEKHVIRV